MRQHGGQLFIDFGYLLCIKKVDGFLGYIGEDEKGWVLVQISTKLECFQAKRWSFILLCFHFRNKMIII